MPISLLRDSLSPLAMALGRKWYFYTSSITRWRFSGLTPALLVRMRDTVEADTPASRAIS